MGNALSWFLLLLAGVESLRQILPPSWTAAKQILKENSRAVSKRSGKSAMRPVNHKTSPYELGGAYASKFGEAIQQAKRDEDKRGKAPEVLEYPDQFLADHPARTFSSARGDIARRVKHCDQPTSQPRPDWMLDPNLLPKRPPGK